MYPQGTGPTYELFSSSRRIAVVLLVDIYMQFFWHIFWAWCLTLKQRARIMVGLEHPTFHLRGEDVTTLPPLLIQSEKKRINKTEAIFFCLKWKKKAIAYNFNVLHITVFDIEIQV